MDKKKILIVDDEADFVSIVKMYLERTGKYEVRAETSASGGIACAREFRPNLIFLDVMMPGMDGGDALKRIEADGDIKKTPVVFLSGVVKEKEVSSRDGVVGGRLFLSKPVKIKELLQCIERNAS